MHQADLIHAAVATERMLKGEIESLRVPANPLDVLAQQTVAACALEALDVEAWFDTVRRTRARSPRCPAPPTRRCWTCSPAATRPTSSPSCGRASSGTATRAPSPGVPAPSGSR